MGKYAIVNTAGTIGKSTLREHLFQPRLPNHEIINVETFNESIGSDKSKNMSASEWRELFEKILDHDHVIVDVGASNIERVFVGLADYAGAHKEFDCFFIPSTPDEKVQRDTIQTIVTLHQYGITKDRIKIIFNRVETNVEREFKTLLNFLRMENAATFSIASAVVSTQLFDDLVSLKVSIHELLTTDESVYKNARKSATTEKEKSRATALLMSKMLAHTIVKNLDEVFASLGVQ